MRPLPRSLTVAGATIALVAPLGLVAVAPSAAAATAPSLLSAGKPATASSHNQIYVAGHVTDGNVDSYWESAGDAFPQWVQVDLGAVASVTDVNLALPTGWEARDQMLSVQGSTDGSSFTNLKESASYTIVGGDEVAIDVTDTSARYVRVAVTANTGWPAAQLSEMKVYGETSTTPPVDAPTGDDLALDRPATASSTQFTFGAGNAVDSDPNSYWEGGSGQYPSTLAVSLASISTLEQVAVSLPPLPAWGPRTQTFSIEAKSGDGSWETIVSSAEYAFDNATGNTVTVPVSGEASDVRLVFTGNTGAGNGQVAGFTITGASAPNPDLTVTDVTASPADSVEGTELTLTATVNNEGDLDSAATTVDLTVDGAVVASADVPAIPAGDSTTVSSSIGTLAAGSYGVGAIVDPSDAVVEQDETNNAYTSPTDLTVDEAPGADLQVLDITSTPANPAVGTPVSFTVSVKNRGSEAAGASVTELLVGSTTLTGSTPAIESGDTAAVTIDGTWTATSGGANLAATADADDDVTETNENNNTFSKSIVVGRGAAVPFTEYEAEDGTYTGTLLETDPVRTFGHTNFATESSGRESVRLDGQGQYVEFTSTVPTNSIVVRNSIPDAPGGGGQEKTISLYADGVFVQKLVLSSVHSWLYGDVDGPEALSNTPGPDARRLFDETSALLDDSYPAGTVFRLQQDADDDAAFYVIDLVDLEQVAAPLSKPADCTSITEYGAVPNDGIDDADAIQAAVTADQEGEINCVWIPEGQWRQEKKIFTDDPLNRGMYNQVGISDATIRGAGMWHSQLYSLIEPQDANTANHPHEGNFGFDIDDNVQLSDIAIFGSGRIRGGDGNDEGGVGLNGRFGQNTKITNVWIEHANVGVWVGRDFDNIPELWGPADGLEFEGMRIRNTYADGINFSNGTRNSTVFNSSLRTTGDDALAMWANPYVKDRAADNERDNSFVNNTIQLPWRANGIAIYGGIDNTIENNVISDTMNYPGIMLATDHSPLPFGGTTLIANNGLYRTGGAFWNEDQEFGAITLFPSTLDITGVVIRDTDIVDSTYDGIQFKNGGGVMPDVEITNVNISDSNNGSGILAMSGARGNAILKNVTISGSRDGDVHKEPGSQFVFDEE